MNAERIAELRRRWLRAGGRDSGWTEAEGLELLDLVEAQRVALEAADKMLSRFYEMPGAGLRVELREAAYAYEAVRAKTR